jgi:hypothetical protein
MRKHVLRIFYQRIIAIIILVQLGLFVHGQQKKPDVVQEELKVEPQETVESMRDRAKRSKVVLLNPYDAINYIKNYREKFCKGDELRHTKSIFLDASYFHFFYDFFTKSPNKYDGMRIFFASYHKMLDPAYTHQKHEKQISLIMAPTIDKVGYLNDFHVYANGTNYDPALVKSGVFCPGACDTITVKAKDPVTPTIPVSGGATNPFIFLRREEADVYIANYRKRYCKLWNKKHTKSLWMPLIDFDFLCQFFEKDRQTKKYAGVRVYFAAYNQRPMEDTKNAREKQITLIFVAASNNDTKNPDFDALLDFYPCFKPEFKAKSIKKRNKKRSNLDEPKNENHGELCPHSCDDDDH